MRRKTNFEAYYDDYYTICAYLSKNFYNGKSNVFYLRTPEGSLEECKIVSQANINNDYIKYVLSIEQELSLSERYELVEEHALTTELAFGLIVKTETFEEEYSYDGSDLGTTYTPEETKFVFWAPLASEVLIRVRRGDNVEHFSMDRTEKGVFRYTAKGDYDGALYFYLLNVNGVWKEVCDPYANATNANGKRSMVMNPAKVKVDLQHDKLPKLEKKTDAIIYETSIRDFSFMMKEYTQYTGKYLGFIEEGKTIEGKPVLFDHLLKMGVTHVQIMPIHDFATVDELNIDKFYNWGYDPVSYHSMEGSYSSNPNDGYTRIKEFKQLVAKCHEHGIRVVLDLVYNHYYDFFTNNLQNSTPNYFFQMDKDANLSNGSFCGNDFDTSVAMGRKYVIDSALNWTKEYGIDGIRFDLMGIMDLNAVNKINEVCKAVNPDFMVYGEGWSMPTMLDATKQASMNNYHKMPNIGFFNDFFRDHVKGSTNEDEMYKKGYCTGDANYFEQVKAALAGTCSSKFGTVKFLNPTQTINYVECHDNATVWDKMRECCKESVREERQKRQKLLNAVVLLSQGVPFLHSGQEFLRTKYGVQNSYRSNDEINEFDWNRCVRNYDVVDYTADLIALRKKYQAFRLQTREEVEKHVRISEIQPGVILYSLIDLEELDGIKGLDVIINTTTKDVTYDVKESACIVANEVGLIEECVAAQIISVSPLTVNVVERGEND